MVRSPLPTYLVAKRREVFLRTYRTRFIMSSWDRVAIPLAQVSSGLGRLSFLASRHTTCGRLSPVRQMRAGSCKTLEYSNGTCITRRKSPRVSAAAAAWCCRLQWDQVLPGPNGDAPSAWAAGSLGSASWTHPVPLLRDTASPARVAALSSPRRCPCESRIPDIGFQLHRQGGACRRER
jgi:hypothetical protein